MFKDNGDGTITDTKTKLMWEQGPGEQRNWQAAFNRCATLRLAGHGDWRLPTIDELLTIVDRSKYNPTCDPMFGAQSNYYWSSSTFVSNPQLAWVVGFYDGYVYANGKTGYYYVRAVRKVKK